ncbi:MAG: hypothetical protein EOM91_17825 [Sphingobacteriia bacterium]|nr:hypothetical protein [Sphingobacteriia bacterium]NCC41163.1 hypothetical protein [Gammaproteobacteria bacterium]
MRLLQAEASLIEDLKDESEVIGSLELADFTVLTARHPTLGKLILIVGADGSGAVVEADE